MMLTLFQIVALLAVMIAPLGGPRKKKKELEKKLFIDTDVSNAHYAIDPNGFLVEIQGKELSKNEL
jgi:hypothetical protein